MALYVLFLLLQLPLYAVVFACEVVLAGVVKALDGLDYMRRKVQ